MRKLLVMLVLLILVGCLPKERVLTYVIIPAEEGTRSREQYAPFIKYLSDELGREVELMVATDYTAAVEALKYGHADFARLGPFSYIMATQEAEVEAFAAGVRKHTGSTSYHGLIIARADRNITDLNGRSIAFADIGSTSGYLAPMTYLMQEGIETGKVFFAGSHSAVIESVKNGTVDVGAISDARYAIALEEGIITEDEVIVLWKSDPIPNSPIAVQKNLAPELKEQIKEAFLNAPQSVVEATGTNDIQFVEISDSDCDIVRRLLETKERLAGD